MSCNPPKVQNSELEGSQASGFSTIAFGSCNKHDLPQPLWKLILEEEPDLWIWLGDNIYGDRHIAEIAKATLPNGNDIYEVTSSGLTHTWKEWKPEVNKYRVAGDHVAALHYGLLTIDWEERDMNFAIKGENRQELFTFGIPF